MAKFHLDRLKKKYGWTGGSYRKLMADIITVNSGSLSRAVARTAKDKFAKMAKRVSTKESRMVLPDITDAIPKRSVFARKGAEKGKILTDKLRDRLTKSLRETLMEFTPRSGQPAFVLQTGKRRGRVNPKLVAQFEKSITADFEGYTKVDPGYGIPANIHGIAVTEVRAVADEIKWNYSKQVALQNTDFEMQKMWIHNKALSEVPRPHHMSQDRKTVDIFEAFHLSNGASLMYPHDPDAPAEEVINCHCDYDVLMIRLT